MLHHPHRLRRQVLTYGELGRLIGYNKHVSVIGCNALGPIMRYCEREGLPALTSIVVNEQTGKPGLGFNTRNKETAELQNETFNFDWFAYRPRKPSYKRQPNSIPRAQALFQDLAKRSALHRAYLLLSAACRRLSLLMKASSEKSRAWMTGSPPGVSGRRTSKRTTWRICRFSSSLSASLS